MELLKILPLEIPPVIMIEQGYEIHCPSLVDGRSSKMAGRIQVEA
jgi:hypothetical protein